MKDNDEGSFSDSSPAIKQEPSYDGTETETTTTVKLPGNRTVTMHYSLAEITPAQRRKLTQGSTGGAGSAQDEEQALDLLAALIESCVSTWDYKTRKGRAIEPVADAVLEYASQTDLVAIFQAMFTVPSGNAEGAV